jgi:hypothetical protein
MVAFFEPPAVVRWGGELMRRPYWKLLGGSYTPEQERAIIERRMREINSETPSQNGSRAAAPPLLPPSASQRPRRGRAPRSASNARRGPRRGCSTRSSSRGGDSGDEDSSEPPGGRRPTAGNAQLPLDPAELAELSAPERGAIYKALGLGVLHIAGIEETVRAVLRGEAP